MIAQPVGKLRDEGLVIDYEFDSGHVLTSVSSYRESEIHVPGDPDGSPLDIATTDFFDTMEQVTQEMRLAPLGDGKFDSVAGLFYFDATNKNKHDVFTGTGHPIILFFSIPSAAALNDVSIDTTYARSTENIRRQYLGTFPG